MFVFKDFKKTVNFWPKKEVVTDNIIFVLHYRLTFLFLLTCMVIVSSRQFIGEHINCISDQKVSPVINTFCFFSATFTVTKYHNASYEIGTHKVHSGVGPWVAGEDIKHHAYYQWVPFVLLIQALFFYAPHLIWKSIENGRLKSFVNSAKSLPFSFDRDIVIAGKQIDSEDTKKKKEKELKEAFLTVCRFKINRDWALGLVLCEFLNAVNIILQFFMVDAFLQGDFFSLGSRWLGGDETVLDSVFPKLTKCLFHSYGSGGSLQNHDALCVMALNIINEKIYTILWFWFIGLLVVTCIGLVWRILTLLLHSRSGLFNKLIWREVSHGPALKEKEIEIIATKLSFSDWLFLYYLGKNMEGAAFKRTVTDLTLSLSTPLLTLRESEKSNLNNESFC